LNGRIAATRPRLAAAGSLFYSCLRFIVSTLGGHPMRAGRWVREHLELLRNVAVALAGVGVAAGLFIILVRVPELAETRRDRLFGSLLGAAVTLLFVVVALLINLTIMVHGKARPPAVAVEWGGPRAEGGASPGA
jgi:hypothetical protein